MNIFTLISAVVLVISLIILIIGIYHKNTNAICTSKKRLDGKTTLITGGTAGMGFEVAKDFAQRGARVIVACPFEVEGMRAVEAIIESSDNQDVVFKLLDLASFESTRQLAADILKNENRLDILVNNAGVSSLQNTLSHDGLNVAVQVNYFGHFLLTLLLLPLLKKTGNLREPSRIVNISSLAHRFGRVKFDESDKLDLKLFPLKFYFNSKLYQVLFSRELTIKLQDSHVVVNNVDPGVVGTGIFSTANHYIGFILTFLSSILSKNPWEGAQTAIHVALDKKAGEVSGEYFKNCKQARAVGEAYNNKLSNKLFEESVRLVKLTNEELNQCFES